MVRRYVGYARYDTPGELALLNQLYEQLRLYVNFFLPSQKLEQKVRRGSRVSKRYSPAKTPYQRVLESTEVSTSCQRKLRAQYGKLNPAQLHREIVRLQEKLMDLTAKKRRGGAVTDGKTKRFPTAPCFCGCSPPKESILWDGARPPAPEEKSKAALEIRRTTFYRTKNEHLQVPPEPAFLLTGQGS